jgi:CBS domain-containing protein
LILGNPGVWALVGMAGILSGAMRAPLTGALFAVEVTGLFDALPLTVASAGTAYAVSVLIMRRSILTEKIARRGRHIRQEYVVDPMDLMQARDLMTPDPAMLPGAMTVGDALSFFAEEADHRSYPVIDAAGRLLGLASRTDALGWRVADMPADRTLADLVSDAAQPVAFAETPVGQVADLIVESGVGRIPIIDPATRRVVGILSRHDLLKARHSHRQTETARTSFRAPGAGE